jgi:hypothetical protein
MFSLLIIYPPFVENKFTRSRHQFFPKPDEDNLQFPSLFL